MANYANGMETKGVIVDTCKRLFIEKGYKNTTYAEIEWLNNTSIACGVTAVQYFCYWTPLDGVESFLNAMVTADGMSTEASEAQPSKTP